MDDMKIMSNICEELDKIADKGLTTSNIETAYKLVDMYKDLKTVRAMDEAGYSDTMGMEQYPVSMRGYDDRGNSMAKRGEHYVRGHYSRDDGMSMNGMSMNSMNGMNSGRRYSRDMAEERYSQAKMDYRNSRAGKQDVMESLNQKMQELKKELEEMSKDSDFPEERQKIDKYVQMLDKVM